MGVERKGQARLDLREDLKGKKTWLGLQEGNEVEAIPKLLCLNDSTGSHLSLRTIEAEKGTSLEEAEE